MGNQGRFPSGRFPLWSFAGLPCHWPPLSASVCLHLEVIPYTLIIWHDYINFHYGQRKGDMMGWGTWDRPLFWKEVLLLCPGLKCSRIAKITFLVFSKISLVNQTTEDIFRSSVCLMKHLMSQCDFWLQGINAYLCGHPSKYPGWSVHWITHAFPIFVSSEEMQPDLNSKFPL